VGGTYKAGSKVRMFTDTNQYYYPAHWTSATIPDNWTEYNITFKANDLSTDYKNMLNASYFLGIGCQGRIKIADFRLENISSSQPRVPNGITSPVSGTYRAVFDDYSESTSSVNQYGQLNTGMLSEGFLPVRYIRDWINGSTASTSNLWREIQAFDRWGRNVAFAADGTWSGDLTIADDNWNWNASRYGLNRGNTTTYKPLHVITNGVSTSNKALQCSGPITLDMGIIHYIDKIKIWHYYNDGRTYHNTKTEVSIDGVNWITVFDSAIEGEYAETSAGHTIRFDKPEMYNYSAKFRKGGEILVEDFIEQ
jgi:hypothetical protein